MKKTVTFLIIFLFNTFSFSQTNIILENQKTFGGSKKDQLKCILKSDIGYYWIAGNSESNISFEKEDSCRGTYDYWIIYTDNNYNIEWQKTIGGKYSDIIADICEINNGNILVLGTSSSPISGDKTIDNYGGNDFWLIKLDKNGNIIWQNTYGGSSDDDAINILKINSNRYLLCGTSDSDISGTKTQNSRGGKDYWVVCIDSSGNYFWDKTYGGTSVDKDPRIIRSPDGNLLLCGVSGSLPSFEKTQALIGLIDVWLIKIDTNGNIIWDKTYGGSQGEYTTSIFTKNDITIIASSSDSDISGTKSENCRGLADYWLFEIDNNGNQLWDKTIGGDKGEEVTSVMIDNGQVIVAGTTNSGISGDKTTALIGIRDYWLYAIDTTKIFLWEKDIGGTADNYLSTAINIGSNNYLIGGFSDSDISGDKTEFCRGQFDFWIISLQNHYGMELIENTDYQIYPNPFSNNFTLEFSSCFKNATVSVCDLNGREVYRKYFNGKNCFCNPRKLENGNYLIKIYSENKLIFKDKLIKINSR